MVITPPTPARYEVEISHRRRDPLDYGFTTESSTWLINVDAVPRLPRGLRWLADFAAVDHLPVAADAGDSASLRANVDHFLLAHHVERPAVVLMLANPRMLGYVFNPLTVFYCFDATGAVTNVIAEVRNTYGGRHSYLLQTDDLGRAATSKQFYVSPFYPVDGDYSMRLPVPDDHLLVAVSLHRDGDHPFTATMTGARTPGPARLWSALRTPLATRLVMAGIKRHGITLYLKGLRPFARPPELSAPDRQDAPALVRPDSCHRNGIAMKADTRADLPAIDPLMWPDVVRVPHHPLRAVVAERLVKRAFGRLPIRVTTSTGERFGSGGCDAPDIQLARPKSFYERVGASGLIGFGEAFMAGDWTSDRLADVLTVMAGRMSTLIPPKLQRLRSAAVHARPSTQDNTVDGARDNIHRHYDLSNELFALFLDSSMTYSSALFDGAPEHNPEDLNSAQHRKIDRLLDVAGVGAGTSVLEIGTGWGELAIRAAARGAHVTTVTISTEQAELASKRVVEAGFSELVEVRLQDYREVIGQFDSVVSVEMIEAVGANHWDEYFGGIERVLRPGGRLALQAITMPHDRMLASMDTYTWIVKYIFPGGLIPSIRAVEEHADAAGLKITSQLSFGLHYAETLRRWRETFESEAAEIGALGFDAVFRRMFSLYLAYSEAGFRSRYLDVVQFGFTKDRTGA